MWRISVFLCSGRATLIPVEQKLRLLCKADPEHWQGEPLLLLRLRFVAIGVCRAHRARQSSGSKYPSRGVSWPGPPAPAPAGALRHAEMLQRQPSGATWTPVDSEPRWQALGHLASGSTDTLPWQGNRGRHKSATGQWSGGCKHQRTTPVNGPIILYMKLLAKPTALNQPNSNKAIRCECSEQQDCPSSAGRRLSLPQVLSGSWVSSAGLPLNSSQFKQQVGFGLGFFLLWKGIINCAQLDSFGSLGPEERLRQAELSTEHHRMQPWMELEPTGQHVVAASICLFRQVLKRRGVALARKILWGERWDTCCKEVLAQRKRKEEN